MYNQLKHVFIADMSTTAYLIWHIPRGLKTSTNSVAENYDSVWNDHVVDYNNHLTSMYEDCKILTNFSQ